MSVLDSARGRPMIVAGCDLRWLAWRREQLARVGCDDDLAVRLAASRDVDLHEVLDLIAQGWPPPLAARLVVPLADHQPGTLR